MGLGCTRCGAPNREGRRFCKDCGAPLGWSCSACSFENAGDERFCGGCGRSAEDRASQPGELRQVVVLFCDLEDYTGMSGRRDIEDVHELLGRFFHTVDGTIASLGGTIDKHIGDNVMALFGAPIAHGNDAERAVRAAQAIHARLEELGRELQTELKVHIGIAAGQVMASGLGSQHHREYTVIGHSVNLAARLQAKAGGGETLIDDSVYRAVAHLVEADALENLQLKGIGRPLTAWRVKALRAALQQRRPTIGRDAELGRMRAVMEDCAANRRGSTVLLSGEPGIGKSHLAAAVAQLGAEMGFRCHRAELAELGAGRAALETLLGGLAESWALDEADAADPMMKAHVCEVLGQPIPQALGAQYEALAKATRVAGQRAATASVVRQASATASHLLVAEDVHSASPDTLHLVAALAAAAEAHGAVLLVTGRSNAEQMSEVLAACDHPLTLELAPLSKGECVELAAAAGVTREHAEIAAERAGGNPLFLEELARAMAEGGAADSLPGTVQSLALARVDRLAPEARLAVQLAAVLGTRFSPGALHSMLGDTSFDPVTLIDSGLFADTSGELTFRHALLRDGVYAALTRERRRELHARAASVVGSSDLAARALHLDRAGDPAAAQAYLEAARQRAGAFQHDDALQLLARACEVAASGELFGCQMARGATLREVSAQREAVQAFTAAAEAAASPLERCRALLGSAAAHRALSGYPAALEALDQAEASSPDAALRSQIHYHRASIFFGLARLAESEREARAALELANALGEPEWQARGESAMADVAWGVGRVREARDHYEACLAIFDALGLVRLALPNRVMLGWALLWVGEAEAGRRELHRALAEATSIHDRFGELFALHAMAMQLFYAEGDAVGARASAVRALGIAREIGARRFEYEILTQIGEIDLETDLAAARGYAREAVEIARREGVLEYTGPWSLALLARVSDSPEREVLLEDGEELLRRGSFRFNHMAFLQHAVYAALASGDRARAERYLGELERTVSTTEAVFFTGVVKRARAAL